MDLYNKPPEIIKCDDTPRVQEVCKIKGSNNVTIIAFPTSQPPANIKALGLIYKLEPYRERPRQCGKCYSYTHIAANCNREPLCEKCSQPKKNHLQEKCEHPPYCSICRGDHPLRSKTCPIYEFEEYLLNEAPRRGEAVGGDTSVPNGD